MRHEDIPQLGWYCHISLMSSNYRNSCYPWGEEILSKSYFGEKNAKYNM